MAPVSKFTQKSQWSLYKCAGAGDGAQARYPCAPPPFRLPSALPSCAVWVGLVAVAMKNAPAGFDGSKVDVLKSFDGKIVAVVVNLIN